MPPLRLPGVGAFLAAEIAGRLGLEVLPAGSIWGSEGVALPAVAAAQPAGGARGGRPVVIDAVIKVGGSLGRGTCLPELGARLDELGRRYRLLVVPGGGVFADAVREQDKKFGLRSGTAHWMAILAMDQYGHLLADLMPGCALVLYARRSATPPRGQGRHRAASV